MGNHPISNTKVTCPNSHIHKPLYLRDCKQVLESSSKSFIPQLESEPEHKKKENVKKTLHFIEKNSNTIKEEKPLEKDEDDVTKYKLRHRLTQAAKRKKAIIADPVIQTSRPEEQLRTDKTKEEDLDEKIDKYRVRHHPTQITPMRTYKKAASILFRVKELEEQIGKIKLDENENVPKIGNQQSEKSSYIQIIMDKPVSLKKPSSKKSPFNPEALY